MDYYYQIKGKKGEDIYGGNWQFPPIYSGKVSAESKAAAKKIIDAEYSKQFPLRVLQKDLDSNEFLLAIIEMKPGSHYYHLFELKTCGVCENTFYVIDKYNDVNQSYKGSEFCSSKCRADHGKLSQFKFISTSVINNVGGKIPVIYKITNKITGMSYIGKTTQVFTLRWYQHFFHGNNCKFHTEIANSKISDWTFEIVEEILLPENIKQFSDAESFVIERERFYINQYDSLNNGYNSI